MKIYLHPKMHTDKSSYSPFTNEMHIGQKGKAWEMGFYHELGHALDNNMNYVGEESLIRHLRDSAVAKLMLNGKSGLTDQEKRAYIRAEYFAWRLAKSFCKPKYWNEKISIKIILKVFRFFGLPIHKKKLKIIPIYKSIGKKV